MGVKTADVTNAVKELGVVNGDIVLVHSSFKSLGPVDGGAETVIRGFQDALGEEGTLVFPTFTQKNFGEAYKTWHIDKPSDTGYLTEYFRTRPGSVRSDQATHAVSAAGKNAVYLTQTHGHTHKRFGSMGDTPFSADSPWQKMYDMGGKIVMLGVGGRYTTYRHFAEYIYINECLEKLEGHEEYQAMKDRLSSFGRAGVWPHVYNIWVVGQMEEMGLVQKSRCGEAELLCYNVRDFVDFVLKCLRERVPEVYWYQDQIWSTQDWMKWLEDFDRITG